MPDPSHRSHSSHSSPNNQLAVVGPHHQVIEILPPEDSLSVSPDPRVPASFIDALRAALVAAGPPIIPEEDKPALWAAAFSSWIAASPRTGAPRPASTLKAYIAAWNDFRSFHGKQDWLVTAGDVRAWLDDLHTRPVDPTVHRGLARNGRRTPDQVGYSEGTIAQYLAAISSFYAYTAEYPVTLLDGREVPLFDGVNPARARGVPRPRTDAFARATYLTSEQVDALLSAIEAYGRSAPSRNARGLRDYALFVCYFLTGGRNSEIRTWRWQDLRTQADGVYYHWANKGKTGWDQLPPPAWRAVHRYLRLSGRLATIQPTDPIFTAESPNLTRLHPELQPGQAPLSAHEVGRLLKYYARRAGLDASQLHVHVLRHTAYMLYTNGGADVRFCSKLLHHSSLATTTRYDHVMAGQKNTEWACAVAQLPGLAAGPLFTSQED